MTSRDERLRAILDPSSTAVLTMELQNGVVGEGAIMRALVDELRGSGTLDAVKCLCSGARDAGARVVHCTVVARPDGAGSTENCKIFAMSAKQRREHGSTATDLGSPGAELIDGLEDPRDIGYQVVIPTDAVAGVPREYADAVLEHSLSLIATLTSTDEVLSLWK